MLRAACMLHDCDSSSNSSTATTAVHSTTWQIAAADVRPTYEFYSAVYEYMNTLSSPMGYDPHIIRSPYSYVGLLVLQELFHTNYK